MERSESALECQEANHGKIDEKCKEALQTIREYIWEVNPELRGFGVHDNGAIEVFEALSRFSKQIYDFGYEGYHYHEVFHVWQDHPVEIQTQMTYEESGHGDINASFVIYFKDACI